MANEGFLNPQMVIKNLPIKEGMIVCDFGSGSGGWVIPIAKMLKTGVVYAIDILESAISALNGKIAAEGLFNIKPMLGNVEKEVKLKDDYVDIVLMTNLLFQVDNIEPVLREAHRILKTGGLILIVDWKKDAVLGPQKKVLIEDVKAKASNIGLKPEKEFSAGNFHWGLLLKK